MEVGYQILEVNGTKSKWSEEGRGSLIKSKTSNSSANRTDRHEIIDCCTQNLQRETCVGAIMVDICKNYFKKNLTNDIYQIQNESLQQSDNIQNIEEPTEGELIETIKETNNKNGLDIDGIVTDNQNTVMKN
ncbi:hypothetical protein FQA39_LY13074 [Lamprigera yunnana]|nr:hypothetical protein FQA39_LY13074 [Lamprigera yunnana]